MLRRRNGLFSYEKKVSGCWKASNLLVSCVPSITVEPMACEEASALEVRLARRYDQRVNKEER